MWEDPEEDGRISFKTYKHQNRLIAPILQLEDEEEHYIMSMFATSVDVSFLGCCIVTGQAILGISRICLRLQGQAA
jgi:hypothetical protein